MRIEEYREATAPRNRSPLGAFQTSSLASLLSQLGISLAVSTYQAGKLILVRTIRGQVDCTFVDFPTPMGIAVGDGRLALGTEGRIWDFRDEWDAARELEPEGRFDACLLPRSVHETGDIQVHELAYGAGEIWVVNTRFSCLATLDRDHGFRPRWHPPFISELAPEDRCHLNGLAMVGDRPGYVSVLGRFDTTQGWRETKATGGSVLDVESGEVVAADLSMPHSPRWYLDRLWFLESGMGTLATIDPATARTQVVASFPGYTRGLAFHGPYAFVGLSRVRESAVFSGIPLTERVRERHSGVWVVDLRSGETVAFLRFESGVEEIFSVEVLPGWTCPELFPSHLRAKDLSTRSR